MTAELRERSPEQVFDGIFHGRDGANSFVIEDGWIVAQSIHYTVQDTPAVDGGQISGR